MGTKQAEHLRRIARTGGQVLREQRGPEHFREIGRRGGKRSAARGRQAELGRKGGQVTSARFDEAHFQALGKMGGAATRARLEQGRMLLAALEPMAQWLRETAEDLKRMQLQDAGAAEAACLRTQKGPAVTYGDCARLLQEISAAKARLPQDRKERRAAERAMDAFLLANDKAAGRLS